MLPSALIIFREVFEIVLIVGIILAATKDLPARLKYVWGGIGLGLLGAGMVAYFIDFISGLAEGVGQEFLNAGILMLAAIFIGSTVIWMKHHAHELKGKLKALGEDVASGTASYLMLTVIIALALLREGSEIVLFTYGMMASGQTISTILMGAAIGLAGGATLGGLLYAGLVRIPTKYFFRVTTGLLTVLVAGMMSQAMGYLQAAGEFESLSHTVWNSGWLIEDHSITGQTLKALLGYTAQPTLLQIIVYLLTLGAITMAVTLTKKQPKLQQPKMPSASSASMATIGKLGLLSIAIGLSSASSPAWAAKTIYTPYVEQGELELEYYGDYTVNGDDEEDGAWEQKFGVGYGVTDFWKTELIGEFEKEGEDGADAEFTAVEWENKFQLTEPGKYWLDVGALVELAMNTQGGPNAIEGKLLLAKDTGKFLHVANIGVEREFGEDSEDLFEVGASWSTRYLLMPQFEPGLEIYSDFGSLSDSHGFDDQDHSAGPVAYGALGPFKYDVGYLFGLSDHAPDGQIKAKIEYEMHF